MFAVLSDEEFERLPFRDDIEGDYINGASYRAKAYPRTVFVFHGPLHRPIWTAFCLMPKKVKNALDSYGGLNGAL